MPWPTWDQAAIAAVLSAVLWLGVRRWRPATIYVGPVAGEFALIAALYGVWRLARMIPIASEDGAIDRARDLVSAEAWLHLPTEISLQHFVLAHKWLGHPTTLYYAVVHVPATIAFLVWLFFRHRDRYPHWRNALALVTAGCLAIRWIRVAPPRFLPDLGYQDLNSIFGPAIYSGDPGIGVSDQYTAMPSIHVAWAAVVSFGIVACSTSRWRWLFLLHVVLTMLVVSATGNHWWLDGVVAILLLVAALWLDTFVRSRLAVDRDLVAAEPTDASGPRR